MRRSTLSLLALVNGQRTPTISYITSPDIVTKIGGMEEKINKIDTMEDRIESTEEKIDTLVLLFLVTICLLGLAILLVALLLMKPNSRT